MDFSGFKKIHEDDDKAVMRHGMGHEIVIAKAGLSHKLRKHLSNLPLHKDEGGMIEKRDPNPISQGFTNATGLSSLKPRPQNPPPGNYDEGGKVAPEVDQSQPEGTEVVPMNTQGQDNAPSYLQSNDAYSQSQANPPVNPIGAGNGLAEATAPPEQPVLPVQNIAAQRENAVNLQQSANQAQTSRDLQATQNYAKDSLKAYADLQATQNQVSKHIDDTAKAIGDSQINPNHLMQNTSVLGKIGMAIGMILAGYGTKGQGPNPALQFLNQQIDRDVEAQKMGLEKNRTLLGAFQKQYGDNQVAYNMTKLSMAQSYSNQIMQSALKNGDQKSLAEALNAKAQIQEHLMPLFQQTSAMIGLNNLNKQSQGSPQQPEDNVAQKLEYAQRSGLINKEQYTAANKDLDIAQKTKLAHESADDIMDKIHEQQSLGNRVLSPIQSKQIIASTRARLVPLIMASTPSKRLTKETINAEIDPQMEKLTSSSSTADEMRKNLHATIDAFADKPQTLNGLNHLGIQSPKYVPKEQIKTVNGVQYKRGPNGEAVPVK